MLNLSVEGLTLVVQNHYGILIVAVLSITITSLLLKAWGSTVDITDEDGIPGRLGLPFFGETFSFFSASYSTKGCYDFVKQRRKQYGKWFKTRILGKTHVFVPSVEGAKTILANDFVHFNKSYVKSMADATGAMSVFSVPHKIHTRIRRLLSDPFSMSSLSKFAVKFDKMVCERLDKLEKSGKSFRVIDFSLKITFDAIVSMLMSVTENPLLEQIEKDCTDVSNSMLSIPLMIPGTRYYKGMKGRGKLNETFGNMIARRRIGEEYFDDFLQTVVDRDSYPEDEKLDDQEIIDNLITLILAGQTTTASAMMWCVKFLSENKDVLDRLREEQLSIVRNKAEGASLTLEDLTEKSYGFKVVKETLRMANVLIWLPRVAMDDCIIDGFEVKKGWLVNVDATCIHYDPNVYKDPTRFNPSRFDDFQKPYSFLPFGAGPRTCLGINMAKVAMLVFVHRLTSGYKWTLDDPDSSLERKEHIPRLRSGCPITLKALNKGK
ncbi:abscisic acid 8'-hydroxylase 3-like [Gossypium arboreum]|uniref:abscisic acid 8'-hydroxylase 3-like n=1 Tax=Gossypium arboreum TaxID=29729 RepID=UPI001E7B0959|nr:abscisic acid 8'-hydroxylase 3-like [Gossypium arboreum]BCB01554.1 5-deoxystrigol synthase [Gossypium arboreum]